MPELPEVETTLRGIKPHIETQKVAAVTIRHPRLRWPIPMNLNDLIKNERLERLSRRGKYLLFEFKMGTLILHLGMSGRVRILTTPMAPQKHDHVDIHFANKKYLRFTDPRRFGALLWTDAAIQDHPLIKHLGPEPLTAKFTADYLYDKARRKKAAVKSFIMDNRVVTGVGNIYATEALFAAQIDPLKSAADVTRLQYAKLVTEIKTILKKAIQKGGTTLKDFSKTDGSPGYFSLELKAYGHADSPCPRCKTVLLKSVRLGQRSTVYCARCQK